MEKKPTYEELEQRIRDLERGKSVEQGLRLPVEDQEAMYRLILENISDTVIVTDDQGNMLYVCPNTTIIFGLSQDQVYNQQTIQRLMNGTVCDISELKKQNEIQGIERSITNSYGKKRYLLINTKAVSINGGSVLYVMRDITDRKQIENDLNKYKNIVSSTADGIAFLDENYRYVIVNDAYERFSGLDKNQFIGKTVSEYLGDEIFKQHIKPNFDKCLQGETVNYGEWFEYPSLGKRFVDITYYPYREGDDQILGVISNTRDITERKHSEDALREAYNIINRSPAVVFLWKNSEGWPVEFVSDNVKVLFGYTAEEFTSGKVSYAATVYPGDLERVAQEVTKYSEEEGREGFGHKPYRIFTKDGETKWLGDMTFIRRNEKGDITHYQGIVLDITERKRVEEEKERLQSQLQQSQKMEAIGTLAGGIAHDFNNILAIILGNAELAADDVPDGNPATENLEEIRLASIRAKDMVQQLLSFSRKTDEESKPLEMVPVIKESMKMLRSAIPTSVEFRQYLSDDPCDIMGDVAQLNQILMNLFTNAAHAMPKGGLIEMTLKKVRLMEEKSCFDWILSPGDYVNLNVRDTGGGIDPAIMDRIFEPYYTTKEIGKGTGMGLSVVHGIVKRHGGGIRVESALGKGTLFEIYFPALEKMAVEEKEPNGGIKGGSERILFVDDEESMVSLNRQRLERLGYQVKTTTKPVEALEWFKADPDQFDVIITDLTMPQMAGDRLAAEILKIRSHMPVIICSGYSERMSAKKADALGVRKYIEKPVSARNLATALREVLDEQC
jgi:PAS domain S-box-containing protein